MRRLLLVANPSASGFTGAVFREVTAILSETYDVTAAWPDNPEEARHAAEDAAAVGYHAVVAMGGDGVVHHVGNGLVHTDTALGVIPVGTTNVVARILDLPKNPKKAARALATAQPVRIPVAHIATESPGAARSEYALFSLGVGFDADVVTIAEQRPYSKVRFGSIHYARTAVGRLFGHYRTKPPNLRVECNGDGVDAVTLLVQVHDLFTYFGRIPLAISHDPVDGLTAAAIERVAPVPAAGILGRLSLRRDLGAMKGVTIWQNFHKLVVQADPQAPFQADGELLGSTGGLEVTPVPAALLVLTPEG
jgi:diacylglycerol kinase family enzyme